MARIGCFGGTFDPPHNGHLAVALAAADRFALDLVLLAPAGLQPLKLDRALTPFADRCAMLERLAAADPRLRVTMADAPHPDGSPNYAIDLLHSLTESLPAGDTLMSITGIDAFAGLPHWREPRALLGICDWILVSRPGLDVETVEYDVLATLGFSEARHHIHRLEGIAVPFSATDIRKRLASRQPCDDLVLPSILAYIAEHHLYAPDR